ncbi:MAG TPA: SulP family inorganic anion transporter [Usitatibacter sp.]|jgi:sulfate permease, SulP family|nr:SulP family inorganic anion transporter [Usitatibacter sp.]
MARRLVRIGAGWGPGWLRGYGTALLRADLLGGVTAAAVVVPIAMAHATIAGLPVQAGLCTVIAPMVVYAFIGCSRALSVSTTSTIAVLVAAAVAQAVPGADEAHATAVASTLALLAGGMLVAASVAKLGFVANFISYPVLTGFKAGIGLVIVIDQVPKLLGISIAKEGFFRDVLSIAASLPSVSWPTLAVGAGVMAIVFAGRRWAPHVPAALAGIVLAIAASALLGLEAAGVPMAGRLEGGLPGPAMPDVTLAMDLWPAAAGIALMSFTESIAAGRAFTEHGERRPAANRELAAIGLANAAGSLFGGMPCGGGTTQTAVNRSAGARTQVAALVTAAVAALALAFLGPVIALMPRAALAAVVLAYSIGLIDLREFRAIRAVRTTEFQWALIACGGVLMLGTLRGILVAIAASLLALAHQANNPPVYELVRKRGTQVFRARSPEQQSDESWPGLLVLRPQGRLYFANAERVGDRMWELFEGTKARVLVLDFSAVSDIEYTALTMLDSGEEKMRALGVQVWLAGLNPLVLAIVRATALGRRLGHERMFFDVPTAVAAYEALPAG